MTTKIKICGLTQAAVAKALSDYPVDAIGLVFYQPSPRFVDLKNAQAIVMALPPFINRVALFVNAQPSYIDQVLNHVAIDTVQFHGNETPEQCLLYQMPFIKAVAVDSDCQLEKIAEDYHQASALLLDTPTPGYGGSGSVFDWGLIPDITGLPIILAGGLNAANVAAALSVVKPYAVDVSSGVESEKGIKDVSKINAFVQAVKSK